MTSRMSTAAPRVWVKSEPVLCRRSIARRHAVTCMVCALGKLQSNGTGMFAGKSSGRGRSTRVLVTWARLLARSRLKGTKRAVRQLERRYSFQAVKTAMGTSTHNDPSQVMAAKNVTRAFDFQSLSKPSTTVSNGGTLHWPPVQTRVAPSVRMPAEVLSQAAPTAICRGINVARSPAGGRHGGQDPRAGG